MIKRIDIFIVLIIVICLFFITTTIAFITRSITAENVITFGNIKMQLIQTTLDENNQEKYVKNDEDINITYKPTVSRIVKIKNLGKHDFFVRISLNIIETITNTQKFNTDEFAFCNSNTDDWIYRDGWYYYKKIVKQNEITSNLTTELKFDIDNIITNYPKGKFKFKIKAEAVQAKNNAENVLDVVGWPLE